MATADRPDRIAIIYLVYDNRDIEGSLNLLRATTARLYGDCATSTVIVDNASVASSGLRAWTNGDLVVAGDNRLHEFSGWERGYEVACDAFDLTDRDLVLFANDTFDRLAHRGYLDTLDRKLVENRDVCSSSVGFCDDFPGDARLLDLTYRWWFRSNIFIHPKATVDRLLPLSFPAREKDLFSSDPGEFWNDSDLISENWKAYVSCWLFGAYDRRFPEYQLVWHKAEPLTAANTAFFRVKAFCILSEHYMGARLANWRVPIIDFNLLEQTSDRHLGNYERQFLEKARVRARPVSADFCTKAGTEADIHRRL
jgi:hypothetical protein